MVKWQLLLWFCALFVSMEDSFGHFLAQWNETMAILILVLKLKANISHYNFIWQ